MKSLDGFTNIITKVWSWERR